MDELGKSFPAAEGMIDAERGGWLGNGIGLWIFIYLLFAMKRLYNQSWKKTSLKFFLFAFLFLICLWLGVVVSALFLLMLI